MALLTIRTAQMDVLRSERRKRFENLMVHHLRRFFKRRTDGIGEDGLRELIRSGMEKGTEHGFRTEQELCRFIDLMLLFGTRFDQDVGWAREILQDSAIENRSKKLMFAAKAHLQSAV